MKAPLSGKHARTEAGDPSRPVIEYSDVILCPTPVSGPVRAGPSSSCEQGLDPSGRVADVIELVVVSSGEGSQNAGAFGLPVGEPNLRPQMSESSSLHKRSRDSFLSRPKGMAIRPSLFAFYFYVYIFCFFVWLTFVLGS